VGDERNFGGKAGRRARNFLLQKTAVSIIPIFLLNPEMKKADSFRVSVTLPVVNFLCACYAQLNNSKREPRSPKTPRPKFPAVPSTRLRATAVRETPVIRLTREATPWVQPYIQAAERPLQ
jgi:hypothetical protein